MSKVIRFEGLHVPGSKSNVGPLAVAVQDLALGSESLLTVPGPVSKAG